MTIRGCDFCKHAGLQEFFHGEAWTYCHLLDIAVEFHDHMFRIDKLIGCIRHSKSEHEQDEN